MTPIVNAIINRINFFRGNVLDAPNIGEARWLLIALDSPLKRDSVGVFVVALRNNRCRGKITRNDECTV